MATRNRRRNRWSSISPMVDFGSLDLHLTIEDIMADLAPGWLTSWADSSAAQAAARTAA